MTVTFFFFFFNDTATTEIYTLSLPTLFRSPIINCGCTARARAMARRCRWPRSEEHTSELQSRSDLVCRLLLEKKKKHKNSQHNPHDVRASTAAKRELAALAM